MEKPELSSADRDRVQKSADLMVKLEKALSSIMPAANEDEIGSLSHDLADLWSLAQQHTARIERILRLPVDSRSELDELLSDLLYGDITELEYHLESLKKSLPGIIENLSTKS